MRRHIASKNKKLITNHKLKTQIENPKFHKIYLMIGNRNTKHKKYTERADGAQNYKKHIFICPALYVQRAEK